MTTATEIANLALSACRVTTRISDVWADEDANAIIVRDHMPAAIAAVSMEYPWPSQMVETRLVKAVVQPDYASEDGAYYAVPSGAFAVRKVFYAEPTPVVLYQHDFDLRRSVPEPMRGLFGLALAAQVVLPIARDNNLQGQILQQYNAQLAQARLFYGQQNQTARSIHGDRSEMSFRLMSLADGTQVVFVQPMQRDYCEESSW